MSFRLAFSIFLVSMGIIVALLPPRDNHAQHLRPKAMVDRVGSEDMFFSVDRVARMVMEEDSTVQLIHIRSPEAYRSFNVPGSINIPFSDLLRADYEGYLNPERIRNILYGNGDISAVQAWTLLTQTGYQNNYVMRGV